MEKSSKAEEKRVSRIKELMKREGIKQVDLADSLEMEPQNFSRILRSGKVTEKTCKKIVSLYPEYRLQWLLGYDDCMTLEDLKRDISSKIMDNERACQILIDSSIRNVCILEGIDPETVSIDLEYLVLKAQLMDFCDGMIWNYLKHRDSTHLFSLMDQVEEAIQRKYQK